MLGHQSISGWVSTRRTSSLRYGLNFMAFQGAAHPPGQAAGQTVLGFGQVDMVTAVGDGQGGRQGGQAAAHDQGLLTHREELVVQGSENRGPGHGHLHQFLGLFGGHGRRPLVDPGVLVPDIGHFK